MGAIWYQHRLCPSRSSNKSEVQLFFVDNRWNAKTNSNGTPFLMYPRFVQLFLNKQLEGVDRPQDFMPSVSLPSKVFTFMRKHSTKFSCKITPLTPSMLEVVTALAAETHRNYPHSRAASSARDGSKALQPQKTADFQGTDDPHDAASIPKSPNDYTPTDVSQTSGGDEGLLDVYALNREDKGILSEEHKVQEEDLAHPFFDDTADQDAVTPNLERRSDETEEVNIEEKEASNVKSGETEELDLETTQSTARQGTITPRILNFEEEAGPSSPLRPIQVMDSEEQLKAAEVLPTQGTDTQRTDPKDKGKGILVEEPKKKKMTLQQIQAFGNANDGELLEKFKQWDSRRKEKRFEELKKTKPKTTLRKPTSRSSQKEIK
ncbi:hypothetical protein Tco_1195474 [Tanacetum coccineum]